MVKISDKNIEILRNVINSDNFPNTYRTNQQLARFFNNYGFNETYNESNFTSRNQYTDDKLAILNSQGKIEEVISDVFNPINFIKNENERLTKFDSLNYGLSKEGLIMKDDKFLVKVISLEDYYKIQEDMLDFVQKRRYELSNPKKVFLLSTYNFLKRFILKFNILPTFHKFLISVLLGFLGLIITVIFQPSFTKIFEPFTSFINDFLMNIH